MSSPSVIQNAAVSQRTSLHRSNTPRAASITSTSSSDHQVPFDQETNTQTTPHVPSDQSASDDSKSPQERKRRLSRNTRGSSRRPQPPPLRSSSKSSSAVPTLSTTPAITAPQSPARNSPKLSGASSPRSWLGRSITMASLHQQGAHPTHAADLLRQAITHK